MLDIYFRSTNETMTFCDRIVQYGHEVELNWKTNKEWGNQIRIPEDGHSSKQLANAGRAMMEVFIKHREADMVRQTIQQVYYFKDKEEVQRILDLTQAMISDSEGDGGVFPQSVDLRKELLKSFNENVLEEKTIHFDSIVKFRLQNYREALKEVVGLAIDEFKREEDYQSFVQSLREYVAKKKSKFNTVHIIQGNDFKFFKANGKPFSKMEIKMLIQQEPLYIVGLDDNELNLTPLLAMSPEKIIIYGDHPAEPKTLTLINVFQEKVVFKPFSNFPFPNYLRN
ncbi:sporulation protein YtxC [Sediminibacillus massiliensis]|uniref:sporulation protein YtxC n=1 Tax=Sediminibacillus massiliensis TaxID=1926277 RepID=UPI001FEB0971|nr:sporulation protein YtxC [Sediminibacillus massiliensis]